MTVKDKKGKDTVIEFSTTHYFEVVGVWAHTEMRFYLMLTLFTTHLCGAGKGNQGQNDYRIWRTSQSNRLPGNSSAELFVPQVMRNSKEIVFKGELEVTIEGKDIKIYSEQL